jgi:hypothetical protein
MAEATYNFDFSSILDDQEEEEKEIDVTVPPVEETKREEYSFDFSSILDAEEEEVDYSETSVARQIGYGANQEPMILGTIGRALYAGAKSLFTDKTFDESFRESEEERQKEIYEDFPEFKGLKEEDETGYMTTGRVGTAFLDPVTWFIPWAKFKKVGTVVAGAAVGGSETALREYALYGDVEGTNVGLSAGIGAVTAGAGDAVVRLIASRKAKGLQTKAMADLAAELDKPEKILPTPMITSATQEAEPALAPMNEVIKAWRQGLDDTARRNSGEIILTDKSPQIDYVKAYQRQMLGKPQSMTVRLTPEETEAVEAAVSKFAANVPEETVANTTFIAQVSKQMDSDRAVIVALQKARKKASDDTMKADIDKQIAVISSRLKESEGKLSEHTVKYSQQRADTQIDMLEDMSQEGSLTSSIMQKVLYETARPIGFGLGGTAIGLTTMEEDDGWGHVFTYAGMGASIGVLQKRIQNSKTFTDIEKTTGEIAIKDASAGWMANATSHLKYITGGSTATRMDAMGGWTKVLGNRLFSKLGSNVESVEGKTQRLQSEYLEKLYAITGAPGERSWITRGRRLVDIDYDVIDAKSKAINTVAGEIMRGYSKIDSLAVGYRGLKNDQAALDAADIAEIQKMVPQLEALRDGMADRMAEVGIKFKKIDNYGLHQVWDTDGIDVDYAKFSKDLEEALRIQRINTKASKEKMDSIEADAEEMAQKITGRYVDPDDVRNAGSTNAPIFKAVNVTVNGKKQTQFQFRSTAEAFETERLLSDVEATKFMYEKGYLNLHAGDSMSAYGTKAIKVAEFSEAFGAKGEIINLALQRVRQSFADAMKDNPNNADFLRKRMEAQEEQIIGSMEAYWGRYGKTTGYVQNTDLPIKIFTTLANATYLTTVSIANLGDLVQPFTNSSYGAAAKTLLQRVGKDKPSFSQMSSFKYDKAYERDLSSFMRKGSGGSSNNVIKKTNRWLDNVNDFYFFTVGLSKVTQVSRNFAYDVGVNRAFELAKKGKLKKKELDELSELKLTQEDLKRIGSFGTAEEAFKKDNAYGLLDRAGRSSSDRDAIIPSVGNRLLFTQTNNSAMRSIGQFMSWAQAKTSQTNRLLERVENGDAQLAMKMLAATPVYAGFLSLKNMANPYYVGEEKDPETTTEYLNAVGKAMKLSGTFNNAILDKALNTLTSTSYREGIAESLAPSLGLLRDVGEGLSKSSKDVAEGNVLKALRRTLVALPVASQISGYTEKITGEPLIEVDEPKRKPRLYNKGGEVLDVPNAPSEPDQRIDKMTGMPYDQQAGTAFTDQEDRQDPLQRMGFGKGGAIMNDPLQRLGFGQ